MQTIGLDEESEAARRYGVLGFPTTFFIDREGKVPRKILGEYGADTFAQVVKGFLYRDEQDKKRDCRKRQAM